MSIGVQITKPIWSKFEPKMMCFGIKIIKSTGLFLQDLKINSVSGDPKNQPNIFIKNNFNDFD